MVLNFEEFKNEVKENIKDYLPSDYADSIVEIKEVVKTNGQVLSGLNIRKEGQKISPTLYLDNYYAKYAEEEMGIDLILDEIAGVYDEAAKNTPNVEMLDIETWENVKKKIEPRIFNTEANKELLKDRPHTDFADLSVSYHIRLDSEASVAVTTYFLKLYKKSVEFIHKCSIKNMRKNNPAVFVTMEDMIASMFGGDEPRDAFEIDEKAELYVLSNTDKKFGAAYLIDSDIMDKIEEKVGSYFVLPSSVHEVLIVPKSASTELEALQNMVREVNANEVGPDDFLSDNVYEYDSVNKILKIATEEEGEFKEVS